MAQVFGGDGIEEINGNEFALRPTEIVARGSWFVVRKNLPLFSDGLRFNDGRNLRVTDSCAQGYEPCIFLRSAVCKLRPAKFPSLPVIILAIVVLVIVVLVIVILAVVIGVIPIPVVIAFGPFLFFVPFVEFVQDKACADG